MPNRYQLAKIVSLGLIIFGLYQIILSLNAIFFIYPQLSPSGQQPFLIQEGLIEKALILYATIIFNGFYGVALLFKPAEQIKIFHIVFGVLIFAVSVFFVVKTPFTVDPVFEFIKQALKL